MATYYHLYDPATDTHYTKGGFIDPLTHEKPNGTEWVEGKPPESAIDYIDQTDPTYVAKTIKDTVAQIAMTNSKVLLRYSGQIGLVNDFLNEGNLSGAVGLLLGLIEIMSEASDDEALKTAQPVISYLESIGVLPND